MTLIAALLALGLALAAPAQDAEAPVAPPAPTAEAPPPVPPVAPGRPLAIPFDASPPTAAPRPSMSPDRLALLRQYRSQRLVLHRETELTGGDSVAIGGVWGDPSYGYPGWGWGGTVMTRPIVTSRTWGIYQGPARLTAPVFLDVAGDRFAYDQLDGRIRKHRRKARFWYGTAGVGLAGIVTGIVGMSQADTYESWRTWNTVSLIGSGFTVGGLIGGSIPSGKASRLELYPSASMTAGEAQARVNAFNDRLRGQLGLTADEVWRIEAREEGR